RPVRGLGSRAAWRLVARPVGGPGRVPGWVVPWLSWRERQLVEAGRLGQAVDEVECLDRLARGALDEVVLDADRGDPAGPFIQGDVDPDVVRARDVLGRGWCGDDGDERLVGVGRGVHRVELGLADGPR